MSDLILVKSSQFEQEQCDFWQDSNQEIFMQREQIAKALGYAYPSAAIAGIHRRHPEILNEYTLITFTNGRRTYYYSMNGICEICFRSSRPNAIAFMDWVRQMLRHIRKGCPAPVQNPVIPSQKEIFVYEKKLRQYVACVLDELEGEIGPLTKKAADDFRVGYTPIFLREDGPSDAFFAFRREFEKRVGRGILVQNGA